MHNRAAVLLAGISLFTVIVVGCSSSDDNSSSSSSTSSSTSSSSGSNNSSGTSGSASSSSSSSSSTSSTGGATGGGGAVNCNSTSDNECVSYSSTPSNATPAEYCSILGTGYAPVSSCSNDALFATCAFTEPSSGVNEVFYWYTAGNFTQEQVTAACNAQHGTLTMK